MSGHAETTELKRLLKPIHLWAIAVGLVISGDYFGWHFGLGEGGAVGMMLATALVTVMYVCFIFSYTELSTAIPHAGGPYAYARRAMGPFAGFVAGFASLIEFVFAPPAISLAIGAYVNFLAPAIPALAVAIAAYLIFVALNVVGVEIAVTFELVVTLIAVAGLLLFFASTAPHVQVSRIFAEPLLPKGWTGVLAAIPFAIWFYLAIEGVAMSAEEVIEPRRDIPRGYIAGILTLMVLAMGTLICTAGVLTWKELQAVQVTSPLPVAMAAALSQNHWLTQAMVYIGLFGLVASFHGIIMGYSRQVFALARAGYLPKFLAWVQPKFRTPVWAIVMPALVGIGAVFSGKANEIITIAVMGAIVLYIISMVSLLVLRKREPELERPYRAPFYPVFPVTALAIATFCLVTVCAFNPLLSLITLGLFTLGGLYYFLVTRPGVLAEKDALTLDEIEHRETGDLALS